MRLERRKYMKSLLEVFHACLFERARHTHTLTQRNVSLQSRFKPKPAGVVTLPSFECTAALPTGKDGNARHTDADAAAEQKSNV